MEKKEFFKENYQLTIHPCNFEVKVKKITPFITCSYKPIILDLKVINHFKVKSFIKIESKPKYGDLYFLRPSTFIYKPYRGFSGFDLFQVLIIDEYLGKHIENIFIHVIN